MTMKTEFELIETTLKRLERPWQQAGQTGPCRLLRLSLLRELTRAIHTLRSECMATDRSNQAADLAHRENYLTQYFPILDLTNLALSQAYSQTSRAAKPVGNAPIPVPLPPSVIATVGEAKFTRQDRRWEYEMAQEAVRQDLEFWLFEASSEIHDVEPFARSFSESIWPRGVVLFVESDGFLKMSKENPNLAFWRGKWLVVLEPGAPRPKALGIDPSWHRLHPPQPKN
jgi:hypothetical protein